MTARAEPPGCIGSVVIADRNHPLCADCGYAVLCRLAVRRNRKLLEESLGKSFVPPPAPRKTPEGMGKKAAQAVGRLERQGLDAAAIRRVFRMDAKDATRATAESTPAWFRWGVLLLRARLRVSRNELANDYEDRFGWSRVTAQSHATIFADVARHLELASETNGILEVRT